MQHNCLLGSPGDVYVVLFRYDLLLIRDYNTLPRQELGVSRQDLFWNLQDVRMLRERALGPPTGSREETSRVKALRVSGSSSRQPAGLYISKSYICVYNMCNV